MSSGLTCGMCLEFKCKSYLQMQHHKANVHGERNQMSRYTKADLESQRKENLALSEEKLKQEISKLRYYNK